MKKNQEIDKDYYNLTAPLNVMVYSEDDGTKSAVIEDVFGKVLDFDQKGNCTGGGRHIGFVSPKLGFPLTEVSLVPPIKVSFEFEEGQNWILITNGDGEAMNFDMNGVFLSSDDGENIWTTDKGDYKANWGEKGFTMDEVDNAALKAFVKWVEDGEK